MNSIPWFERKLSFGLPKEMLPYYLERLEGTIFRIEQKVKGVDDKILSTQPGGKWSIKQHIGHLAEVDEIANKRIGEMQAGTEVMSPAVFEPKDYNPWSIDRVVEYFRANRKSNLLRYAAVPETDLLKSSMHPRLKVPMTPVDLAWFDAEHDDHHLVKINEIIFTLTKS
ncbi:MAG: DinB family protein [Cyclobacteriaceae bacterium]|nr:DinB family protein [Cyclobacteriaceae bacterium]